MHLVGFGGVDFFIINTDNKICLKCNNNERQYMALPTVLSWLNIIY